MENKKNSREKQENVVKLLHEYEQDNQAGLYGCNERKG